MLPCTPYFRCPYHQRVYHDYHLHTVLVPLTPCSRSPYHQRMCYDYHLPTQCSCCSHLVPEAHAALHAAVHHLAVQVHEGAAHDEQDVARVNLARGRRVGATRGTWQVWVAAPMTPCTGRQWSFWNGSRHQNRVPGVRIAASALSTWPLVSLNHAGMADRCSFIPSHVHCPLYRFLPGSPG